jgi:hypothetical protein
MTQDYKYSLETAIEANQKGELFQWLQDYLRGEGGNKELADYLIQEKLAIISLLEFPLSKLKRGAGPEKEMPYIEAPEIWEKRVGKLVEKIKEGIKLPPLIVTDFGTPLGLSDGNHTHEALLRCGQDKYWTIFFFTKESSLQLLNPAPAGIISSWEK